MLVDRDAPQSRGGRESLPKGQAIVQRPTSPSAKRHAAFVEATVARWGAARRAVLQCRHQRRDLPGRPIIPRTCSTAVMAVNVRGPFLGCKYALPKMRDGGSIIMTSSVVGTTSDPGIAAYAASKHAVIGLMRTVAKEAAPRRIRVNVVAPGPIENEFQRNVETGLSRASAATPASSSTA